MEARRLAFTFTKGQWRKTDMTTRPRRKRTPKPNPLRAELDARNERISYLETQLRVQTREILDLRYDRRGLQERLDAVLYSLSVLQARVRRLQRDADELDLQKSRDTVALAT